VHLVGVLPRVLPRRWVLVPPRRRQRRQVPRRQRIVRLRSGCVRCRHHGDGGFQSLHLCGSPRQPHLQAADTLRQAAGPAAA